MAKKNQPKGRKQAKSTPKNDKAAAKQGNQYPNRIAQLMALGGYKDASLTKPVLKQIGCSAQQYGKFYRNEAQPNLDQAQNIAIVFKCNLTDLLEPIAKEL